MVARGPNEANTRYATIKSYSRPNDANPYAQPFFSCFNKVAMPDLTLIIEHGLWQDQIPGEGTCAETSAEQDYADVDDGVWYPTQSADDADTDSGAGGTIRLAVNELLFGRDATGDSWDVGIRFRNVAVPVGATIVAAWIEGTCNQARVGTVCNARVYGELNAAPALFTTYANFVGRARTVAFTNWAAIPAWVLATVYPTPDITAVIQEIIDLGGWASGNDLVVFVEDYNSDNDALREWASWDNVTYPEPELHIHWYDGATNTFGRSATCLDEVYICNKQNVAQLTHVYWYDSTGPPFWSANLIGLGGWPYTILPVGVVTGDAHYAGINTTVPNSGPFCNLVYDIATVATYGAGDSVQWQYWNGGWVNLTVVDSALVTCVETTPWLIAGVLAIREAMDFDTGNAIITVLIGWVIVVVVSIIFGMVFGVGAAITSSVF